MKGIDRIDKLERMILNLRNNSKDELLNYIGTGNPNADILIIGEESSVGDINSEQFRFELKENYVNWQMKKQYSQDVVPDFFTSGVYDPIFPYKGQKHKIDNKSNNGTSRTWYTYQKLINYIYDKPNNVDIDFHKYAFITEVNSTPSRKNKDADISSIGFRKKTLLTSDFFQSFPIVIISGVRYFNILTESNEIEEIFKVRFLERKFAKNRASQPYWIHSNESSQSPKLLINTHQLSIGIADDLLEEIAEMIKNKLKYTSL